MWLCVSSESLWSEGFYDCTTYEDTWRNHAMKYYIIIAATASESEVAPFSGCVTPCVIRTSHLYLALGSPHQQRWIVKFVKAQEWPICSDTLHCTVYSGPLLVALGLRPWALSFGLRARAALLLVSVLFYAANYVEKATKLVWIPHQQHKGGPLPIMRHASSVSAPSWSLLPFSALAILSRHCGGSPRRTMGRPQMG